MKILNKKRIKADNEIKNGDNVEDDVFNFLCAVGIAFILTICFIVGIGLIYNILDNQVQLVPVG